MEIANPKLNGGPKRHGAAGPAICPRYLSPETPTTRIVMPDQSQSIFCSRWQRPVPQRLAREKLTITQCLSRGFALVTLASKRLRAHMAIPLWLLARLKQKTFKNSAFITVLSPVRQRIDSQMPSQKGLHSPASYLLELLGECCSPGSLT